MTEKPIPFKVITKKENFSKDGREDGHPLVTFLLFAYNQEQFIEEAIEGAFSQTYSPMEIILSDDGSSDATFDVMENMVRTYRGHHKVILNRNNVNLGLVPHVNKLMPLCSGKFIAFAAGDDVSLPNRVEDSVSVMTSNPSLSALSLGLISGKCYSSVNKGNLTTSLKPIVKNDLNDFCKDTSLHINAPARMIRKDVFSSFGPLNANCQVEDQPILFRALLVGLIGFSKKRGVFYRIHSSNLSAGPGKKQSFDFKKIYDNCRSDLDHAINQEFVALNEIKELNNAIDRRQKRDSLWRGYRNTDQKWLFLIFKIFPSSVIRVRGKLFYLLNLLKPQANK